MTDLTRKWFNKREKGRKRVGWGGKSKEMIQCWFSTSPTESVSVPDVDELVSSLRILALGQSSTGCPLTAFRVHSGHLAGHSLPGQGPDLTPCTSSTACSQERNRNQRNPLSVNSRSRIFLTSETYHGSLASQWQRAQGLPSTKYPDRSSLLVQWLSSAAPNAGHQFPSLVRELRYLMPQPRVRML